jgi:outer membrane protein
MPVPDANVRKMSGGAFGWLVTIQAMCCEPPRCGIGKLNRDPVRRNRWRQYVPWARVLLCTVGSIATVTVASAQAQTSQTLTLVQAIDLARANYPSLKEVRARANAATEGVGVAKTSSLPRLDLIWQVNRATRNNVFGLVLPQAIVPPISGPVLGTTSYDSVWGSAGGVLLSWQAVDFGLRKANVAVARAQSSLATAQIALTELDVSAAAADAFLSVLAADELVRAARANVDRLQTLAQSVRTLVRNQLRPGADESRADAELAIARNQLSQVVQTATIARATLADAIGGVGATITLDRGPLAQLPSLPDGPASTDSHPAVRAAAASVETVLARERVLARAYAPRLDVQSAFSGRGSGAEVPGQPLRGDGLSLQVPNWAVGVAVSFSALDVFAINARKRVEAQNELAERAKRDQTIQNVTTQQAKARALITAATEIAHNTPSELKAAIDADSRARARYASGLANVTEVAEAARLLAQAEADDAIARLGVWRAFLAVTQAAGDLTPFLERIRQP